MVATLELSSPSTYWYRADSPKARLMSQELWSVKKTIAFLLALSGTDVSSLLLIKQLRHKDLDDFIDWVPRSFLTRLWI